jgi:uncharacterized repeat protein (TIGR03803 family)
MALLLVGLVVELAPLGLTNPNADAQTETILYSFGSYATDGSGPSAGLVQGSDGSFYGTTYRGGTGTNCVIPGCGTVFRISPSGTYTTVYSFGAFPGDGSHPLATLVQGSDGNFYGTTYGGGTSGSGTVFRISPSGTYTTLYSFAGFPSDGDGPNVLVQGSDGNFYGTTIGGGTYREGTVFRISPTGSETILYSFGSSTNDGYATYAGLVQGGDGNFYGTTKYGGTDGWGTVFQVSPSGTYKGLYSFAGPPNDGRFPYAGLVQGSDGNLYGTTYYGGQSTNCFGEGCGTVFRISTSGTETTLYSFVGYPNDGELPFAGLVQGSDGNSYGTTLLGGTSTNCSVDGNGCGTVFQISPSGTYTTLYSFGTSSNDGNEPYAGLVQGSDGNFYGMTYVDGTVFRLSVPLNPPANQISGIQFFNVLDSTIVAVPIPSVAGETYQLQYSDSMSPTNWINTGDPALSIGGPLVLIDVAEPLPPQRFYRAVITP